MFSKRKEHFRFSFGNPLLATLRVIRVGERLNEIPMISSSGNIEILDISPSGLKIQTFLNIPISEMILLEITFTIHERTFTLIGRVTWRNKVGNNFYYGIRLEVNPDTRQQLINELKEYSKKVHQK